MKKDRKRPLMAVLTAQRCFLLTRRCAFLALLFAIGWMLVAPGESQAHAILLRSEPAKDAVVSVSPGQVRLWFSEDLNPALSTVTIVNQANAQVDAGNAHVSAGDPREMDIALKPHLPPAVYVVIYRSASNADGHLLSGSFLFTVVGPDGTAPTGRPGSLPGINTLGGGSRTASPAGQLDGPALVNLLMITLMEVGAVFWVGTSLWLRFVLAPVAAEHEEMHSVSQRVRARFVRRFALPTLLVMLLAHGGLLLGQALTLTGGQLDRALAPSILGSLVTSGRFGLFWLIRVSILLLALLLSTFEVWDIQRLRQVNHVLQWGQLLLGLALLIAMALSSHAAAVTGSIVTTALVADWLHLIAAALWVGGMGAIAVVYLPTLRQIPLSERASTLLTVLPSYSPYAVIGVLLMAVTGPFSATVHLTSWEQLATTAYGQVLLVKVLLVGAMLVTSAFHVFWLRPRLKQAYQQDELTMTRRTSQLSAAGIHSSSIQFPIEASSTAFSVTRCEERLARYTQRLMRVLRFEPMLGVAVLLCVGLMNVFAGTLAPSASTSPRPAPSRSTTFHTTATTLDGTFTVALAVNPNRAGTNTFTVGVSERSSGRAVTNIGVSLYTTHLDTDIGTGTVNLQPDGTGHFSARGDLTLSGHWQIRMQIRTLDNTLHEATVKLLTA